MKYVYILKSQKEPERHYTGLADNVQDRLKRHNAGEVSHTSKYVPWVLETAVMFSDDDKAIRFEQYLKSGSGRAFARKRL